MSGGVRLFMSQFLHKLRYLPQRKKKKEKKKIGSG